VKSPAGGANRGNLEADDTRQIQELVCRFEPERRPGEVDRVRSDTVRKDHVSESALRGRLGCELPGSGRLLQAAAAGGGCSGLFATDRGPVVVENRDHDTSALAGPNAGVHLFEGYRDTVRFPCFKVDKCDDRTGIVSPNLIDRGLENSRR
jgi:hypothetical protein